MTTANRRNITNVYRIKRIKPTKTSYAGQTDNGQRTTHGQKFKSGNRADAIAQTYQINYEKSPARNLPPHVKKDEWRPTFQIFRNVTNGRTDQKNLHTIKSTPQGLTPGMDLLMLPRNISFPGGNFIGGLDEPGQPMPLKMSHFIGLYKLGAVP